jgi:outer membrane protein
MIRYLYCSLRAKTTNSALGAVQTIALASGVGLLPVASLAADIENSDVAIVPAQEFDSGRYGDFRDTLHDWKLTVGAGAVYMPEYEGSDEFEIIPLPIISAEFGDRVSVDITGVTVDLYEANGFRAGLKAGYDLGRKEDDSDYLRGLGDIDAGGIIGGIISYEVGPFEAYAELDKTIGGSDGLTGTVGSITYMMTENWLVTGAAGAGFLIGDAKNSPIVKDDVQPFAMLGVAYRF